jgi:hypothetical protein
MLISPAIAAIAIAVLMALAFGGGFAVSDWRNGAEIARLESDNAVKSAANAQCATDIATAQTAVQVVLDAAEEREKEARAAMDEARGLVAKFSARVITIKAAPIREGEPMCDAIVREQAEYVAMRRAE